MNFETLSYLNVRAIPFTLTRFSAGCLKSISEGIHVLPLFHLSNISEGYWKKSHSSEGRNKISTFSERGGGDVSAI